MKVVRISTSGIAPAKPAILAARDGRQFWAFTHGEEGRGRWQVRLPLGFRDFPVAPVPDVPANTRCPQCDTLLSQALDRECHVCWAETVPGPDQDYALISLKRQDSRGNGLYLLGKANSTFPAFLVLWSLSPGYRGGASFKVSGQAVVLAEGEEAQGAAGRMGGATCPVVHVAGPCRLEWSRSGRLYGGESDWVAEYDGEEWHVAPADACAVEQAIFEY